MYLFGLFRRVTFLRGYYISDDSNIRGMLRNASCFSFECEASFKRCCTSKRLNCVILVKLELEQQFENVVHQTFVILVASCYRIKQITEHNQPS